MADDRGRDGPRGRARPDRRPTKPVLIDGFTLWLSTLLGDEAPAIDPILDGPVAAALAAIAARPGPVVVVSDEVGSGIVPMHAGARAYRDLVGIAHQRLAALADEVYLLVAGLPITLKGERPTMSRRRTGRRPTTEAALRADLAAIGPLDADAMAAAAAHLDRLTKPPGSLGRLEDLAIQLAGITGPPGRAGRPPGRSSWPPPTTGSRAQGVSAYPAEVTAQMVANFVAGGAAINVLAGAVGARVVVVDAGVAGTDPAGRRRPGPRRPARQRPVRAGDRRHDRGSGDDPRRGARRDRHRPSRRRGAACRRAPGSTSLGIGEMGIGNTTAASALAAVFTGAPVEAVTGRGTGIDDAGRERKVAVIETALARNGPIPPTRSASSPRSAGSRSRSLVGVIVEAALRRHPGRPRRLHQRRPRRSSRSPSSHGSARG